MATCNCDNELKLVSGNDFGLRIQVVRNFYNGETTEEQPLDLNDSTNIKVELVGMTRRIKVPYVIDESDSSVLTAKVTDVPLGNYGVEVSGENDYGAWRVAYKPCDSISIVRYSEDGNVLVYDKDGNLVTYDSENGIVDIKASLELIGLSQEQQNELKETLDSAKEFLSKAEAATIVQENGNVYLNV